MKDCPNASGEKSGLVRGIDRPTLHIPTGTHCPPHVYFSFTSELLPSMRSIFRGSLIGRDPMRFGIRSSLTAIACLFLSQLGNVNLQAQTEFFAESSRALKEGNRLLAVDLMTKGLQKMPGMENVANQYLPLISDYEPVTPFDQTVVRAPANKAYVAGLSQVIGELERQEALMAIVDAAKDRQIVILNEAHDCPQHRAFGLLLAAELKKIGFEFLAMETLVGPDGNSGVLNLDYPKLDTGYYSAEPVFGDFVREAARLGYQLVAYEIESGQRQVDAQADPVDSIRERENAQSDNLIQHVLKPHPKTKLFVYVGYSHATEHWEPQDDGSDLGWMAAQIQKKTGIDPLTIDQVGGSYNPKNQQIDPVLSLLQKDAAIQQPCVLRQESGEWLSSDGYYHKTDMTVFHPIQKMLDGRPNWLRMNGYRKAHPFQNKDYYLGDKTLVQAYRIDEGEGALPVDQVLLETPDGEAMLLLPEGKYRTVSQTIDGTIKDGPKLTIQPSPR